jgi:negative regulator of flagellin synthesis FlgM
MSNVLEDITMVNQINDSAGMKTIELNRLNTRDRQKKEPVAEQPYAASDNVNFSEASKQLEALKTSLKDIPEVDAQKVAHFKAEIAAGNYQINSNEIAKRMLNNVEMA